MTSNSKENNLRRQYENKIKLNIFIEQKQKNIALIKFFENQNLLMKFLLKLKIKKKLKKSKGKWNLSA